MPTYSQPSVIDVTTGTPCHPLLILFVSYSFRQSLLGMGPTGSDGQ